MIMLWKTRELLVGLMNVISHSCVKTEVKHWWKMWHQKTASIPEISTWTGRSDKGGNLFFKTSDTITTSLFTTSLLWLSHPYLKLLNYNFWITDQHGNVNMTTTNPFLKQKENSPPVLIRNHHLVNDREIFGHQNYTVLLKIALKMKQWKKKPTFQSTTKHYSALMKTRPKKMTSTRLKCMKCKVF